MGLHDVWDLKVPRIERHRREASRSDRCTISNSTIRCRIAVAIAGENAHCWPSGRKIAHLESSIGCCIPWAAKNKPSDRQPAAELIQVARKAFHRNAALREFNAHIEDRPGGAAQSRRNDWVTDAEAFIRRDELLRTCWPPKPLSTLPCRVKHPRVSHQPSIWPEAGAKRNFTRARVPQAVERAVACLSTVS